jgi:hypothetical protein
MLEILLRKERLIVTSGLCSGYFRSHLKAGECPKDDVNRLLQGLRWKMFIVCPSKILALLSTGSAFREEWCRYRMHSASMHDFGVNLKLLFQTFFIWSWSHEHVLRSSGHCHDTAD